MTGTMTNPMGVDLRLWKEDRSPNKTLDSIIYYAPFLFHSSIDLRAFDLLKNLYQHTAIIFCF